MTTILKTLVAALFALPLLAAADTNNLVVREWGTFTIVPDESGSPLSWYVASGSKELPEFVYPTHKRGFTFVGKHVYVAVRMETPVLYFYTDVPRTIRVEVDFPLGKVSEWYPHGEQVKKKVITPANRHQNLFRWNEVKLLPGHQPKRLPTATDNHYFAARGVGSTPVQVKAPDGSIEEEEFLFYRGVRLNAFRSLKAKATRDSVILAGDGDNQPKAALVFQRLVDASMRWQEFRIGHDFVEVKRKALPPRADLPLAELAAWIREAGLSQPEADAMLATWKKDWFEEGLRVFYLVPQPLVDDLLPLTITPQPKTVARAFVTRMDLLTPQQLDKAQRLVAAADDPQAAFAAVESEFGRLAVAVLGCLQRRKAADESLRDKTATAAFLPLHALMMRELRNQPGVPVAVDSSSR